MKRDKAIEDIRNTRKKLSRRFGRSTKTLIGHYKELQKKYAGRLVAETPALYQSARGK